MSKRLLLKSKYTYETEYNLKGKCHVKSYMLCTTRDKMTFKWTLHLLRPILAYDYYLFA